MSASEASPAGVTEEGRTATALDDVLALRMSHARKLMDVDGNLEEAAEILADVLRIAEERYGQMSNVMAPVYFTYGNCLLSIAELSKNALEEGEEGGEEGEEEGEEEEAAATVTTAEGDPQQATEINVRASGAPVFPVAEEDLEQTKEADEEAGTDMEVAFQCLDVARVIYSRMQPPSKETDLELARVHLRLGDCYSEGDNFEAALPEYKACLKLRATHLADDDRRMADVLNTLAIAHARLAADKDTPEAQRRMALTQALMYMKSAAESLALLSVNTARADGLPASTFGAFADAVQREMQAGLLEYQFPVGVTTSVLSPDTIGVGADTTPEPEVKVFQSLFDKHLRALLPAEEDDATAAAAAAAAASSSSAPAPRAANPVEGEAATKLLDLSEIMDSLLQRMAEFQADLGVSIPKLLAEIAQATGQGGVTTVGFGAAGAASSGSSSSAAEVSAPTLMARKKTTTEEPLTSGAAATGSVAASSSAPVEVGVKRRAPADAEEASATSPALKQARTEE